MLVGAAVIWSFDWGWTCFGDHSSSGFLRQACLHHTAACFPRVSDLGELGRGANLILEVICHPWHRVGEDYTRTWTPGGKNHWGTSLVGQWLRVHTPSAGNWGSITGHRTRSHMLQWRPSTAKGGWGWRGGITVAVTSLKPMLRHFHHD